MTVDKTYVCILCKHEIDEGEEFVVVPPFRMHRACYEADIGD